MAEGIIARRGSIPMGSQTHTCVVPGGVNRNILEHIKEHCAAQGVEVEYNSTTFDITFVLPCKSLSAIIYFRNLERTKDSSSYGYTVVCEYVTVVRTLPWHDNKYWRINGDSGKGKVSEADVNLTTKKDGRIAITFKDNYPFEHPGDKSEDYIYYAQYCFAYVE